MKLLALLSSFLVSNLVAGCCDFSDHDIVALKRNPPTTQGSTDYPSVESLKAECSSLTTKNQSLLKTLLTKFHAQNLPTTLPSSDPEFQNPSTIRLLYLKLTTLKKEHQTLQAALLYHQEKNRSDSDNHDEKIQKLLDNSITADNARLNAHNRFLDLYEIVKNN